MFGNTIYPTTELFRITYYSILVIPTRFERVTHSLEGCCSIQLSYGTFVFY